MKNNLIKEIDEQIKILTKRKEMQMREQSRLHHNDKVNNYLQGYNGKELLKEHKLDEEGIWEVRGEDPNCDFGGPHHNPFLGHFEGKLEDVIIHAVSLKGFWVWGGGGEIKKFNEPLVTKV